MTAAPAARPNRFTGSCYTCGAKVPAGEGTWSPGRRAQHLPGRCKTTTKTYRDTIATACLRAYREYVDRMLAAAGYQEIPVCGFEPTIYRGHGLTAHVGYDREVRDGTGGYALEPAGFEIRRVGHLIYKGDQPARTRTGWLAAIDVALGPPLRPGQYVSAAKVSKTPKPERPSCSILHGGGLAPNTPNGA